LTKKKAEHASFHISTKV